MVNTMMDDIFKDIVETIREPLLILDSDLKVVLANHSFYDIFSVKPEETIGQLIYDLGNAQWDIPKLRELLEDILPNNDPFNDYEVVHNFESIGMRTMLLNARQIERVMGKDRIILLAIEDITARKKIEAGLEKTRKELEVTKKSADDAHEFADSVINTVREPLISLDQDLRVVSVSRSFCEFFKVKPKETVGQLIYDLGNKQWDIPKLRELLETILPEKNTFDNYEVDHDFETIGRRTMLLNARQIEQTIGKKRTILLAIEDITERNRLENLLKDSEERFRRLFETAEDGILLLEKSEGKIANVNPSVTRILGYSKEDCIGKDLKDIGILHNMGDIFEITKNLNDKGVIHQDDITLQTKTGKTISVEMYCVDKTSLIQSNIRDITERKQTAEVLKNSEKRYRSLFNSIRDAILVADIDRTIIDCNPAFVDLFGYLKEEVLGKQTFSIYESEEEFRRMGNEIKNHMDDPGFVFPVHYKKKDGSVFPSETSVFYLVDDNSAKIGYIGLIRDVTQRKQEQKYRKTLQAQLIQAQKMESIGTLAGGIAHDFNNILSSILGFTELALGDGKKGTQIEEDLQEVYTAGLRAKDLVQQILTFARQSDEELKPIQVDFIIKEVLKFIRSSLPATIEIKQNIASDSLIMGNSTQIHQILMNLCTNASHAMENGGGTLEITLKDITIDRTTNQKRLNLKFGNYIELTISDTGTGIEPHVIEKIFEPYFTTKKPGEGTGFGLALVHGIVETYGGKMVVESSLGKGTTFTIYLPVAREIKNIQQYKVEELPTGQERILFVDDEVPIVKIASRILGQLGYSVTTKTSSVDALELFKSNPSAFDLVISDVTMPKMTGDQLTKELIEIRPDIPVILCTGYSKRLSEEKASEIGIQAFTQKPIVKEDLATTVRKVLDEARDK